MMKVSIIHFLLAMILLSACDRQAGEQPTTEATAVPTEEPIIAEPTAEAVVEPTAEPAEESAADTTSAAAALPPEWDQLLNDWISPDSVICDAPGGVLLVDSPDGRFVQAAGVASLDDQRPLAINDRFEIGSITKSFTSVLALQLQEEGVLSMDDPLSKWLPDLAASIPNGERMTLRQIAQHQAGLADYEEPLIDTPLAEGDLSGLEQEYTADELVQWVIENQEPPFTPGEAGQFQYSNTGYLLLGMVLEAATGETEADLLQERIFGPLAMENTIYLEDSPEPGTIVSGYSTIDGGEQVDVTNWNAVQAGAAGAIASTVEDLALYSQALLAGELFNEEATLEEMLSLAPADGNPFAEYGLGVGSFGSPAVPNIGHAGGTPGFQTSWFYVPEAETTIIFFTNSSSCNAGYLPFMLQPEIFGLDAAAPPAAEE